MEADERPHNARKPSIARSPARRKALPEAVVISALTRSSVPGAPALTPANQDTSHLVAVADPQAALRHARGLMRMFLEVGWLAQAQVDVAVHLGALALAIMPPEEAMVIQERMITALRLFHAAHRADVEAGRAARAEDEAILAAVKGREGRA